MSISKIYLNESATGKLVAAELYDEVSDVHLAMWDATWRPAMKAHCAGRVVSDSPEDHHWDWKNKANHWRPLLQYHSFAIVCRHELQGLMLASDTAQARLAVQAGKPLVYIEFVATAPWNRIEMQQPPRYRGVGTAFVAMAIQLSIDMGYKGRAALHSLPDAETFYKTACGMTAVQRDPGPHQNLMYYELTEKQADMFCQKPGKS
jgi:hypothetical protein